MKKMKHFVKMILVASMITLPTQSHAAEADTHLRISAFMARIAGMNNETAIYAGISNQYIDRAPLTSAMMFSIQRLLNHFAGDPSPVQDAPHGGGGPLSRIRNTLASVAGSWLREKNALATRNHPLASLGIYLGLRDGDFQEAVVTAHKKVDSYHHAGFGNMFGHMMAGHGPDRNEMFPQKFQDMVRSLMVSYVKIRQALPKAYIDIQAPKVFLNSTCQQYYGRDLNDADMDDPVLLAELLLNNTEFQTNFRQSVLNTAVYKETALKEIFAILAKQGVIPQNTSIQSIVPQALLDDDTIDTNDIIKVIASETIASFMENPADESAFSIAAHLGERSPQDFQKKLDLEIARFTLRLQQLPAVQTAAYFEAQKLAQMRDTPTAPGLIRRQEMTVKAMSDRYAGEVAELSAGLPQHETIDDIIAKPELIQARARELTADKVAAEFSLHYTKDFLPHRTNDYIKDQFEGNTDNRLLEVFYKEEIWRQSFAKNFGVNWVQGVEESPSIFSRAARALHSIVFGKTQQPEYEILAEKAASEQFENPTPRSQAAKLDYNSASVRDFNITAFKTLIWGITDLKGMLALAKAKALNHETENIPEAMTDGTYRGFLDLQSTNAGVNIGQYAAQINDAQIRQRQAMAGLRCEGALGDE